MSVRKIADSVNAFERWKSRRGHHHHVKSQRIDPAAEDPEAPPAREELGDQIDQRRRNDGCLDRALEKTRAEEILARQEIDELGPPSKVIMNEIEELEHPLHRRGVVDREL